MAITMMGPLTRGKTGSSEFALYNFSGGLNVKDVPEQIGDNDLVTALNGYLRAGGGFASRYGMTQTHNFPNSLTSIKGIARFYQGVLNGSKRVPQLAQTVVQLGDELHTLHPQRLVGSLGNEAQPWTVVQVQNPNAQYYPGGLTDCLVICTGSGGPYVFDGSHVYTPAGWAAASGAKYVALVNGIAWFGGIDAYPNQTFGTGTGQQDDGSFESLPAFRNFVYSGPVTGLAPLGTGATAALCIGRNNGLTVLSGTGTSNFYQQDVPMSDGCTAGRTMVATSGSILFLGNQAIYRFDGVNPPTPISYKIEPWVLNDQIVPGYPISARTYAWGCVYNNRYHLGYYSGFGDGVPNTLLTYDLLLNGWTVHRVTPGLQCMALKNAPIDPSPWTAMVGSATTAQTFEWDVQPSEGERPTDNGTPFIVQMETKYFKYGIPGTVKALRRVYPEVFVAGGLWRGNFIASSDYGSAQVLTPERYSVPVNSTLWNEFNWNKANWSPNPAYRPLVAPQTRIDYDGLDGDAFSLGVQTTTAVPPWVIGGFSGLYHQRGRV